MASTKGKKRRSRKWSVVHPFAAGIDIGSKFHVVAVPEELDTEPVRTFSTFTNDLYRLADWLKELGILTVAMESTGVYWIPAFEILQSRGLEVVLVNARDANTVPGRKTDVNDAQWLQQLHQYGLLRAGFHPSQGVGALRAYLRHRERLLDYAAAHVQHMQKALMQMNVQLQHVVSDVTGATGLVATLLDEGQYLCSERTMYRVLAANQSVRERRNQREHPQYTKPQLVATGPNQTWSWDITKLLGPTKWTYFYLYVLLDIFSRYVVGWMVADRENSTLAGRLIEESCLKQGVEPQVLTLHSDRGAPMTSKCTAQLLADLGITRSLSRPQVCDDNPFSEAQFKTLKYHPEFPGRFSGIEAATTFCRSFFPWYNTEHRHGGISMLTPHDVHHGRAPAMIAQRQRVLQNAWTTHPERFVRGQPKPSPLPETVWINPPDTPTGGIAH